MGRRASLVTFLALSAALSACGDESETWQGATRSSERPSTAAMPRPPRFVERASESGIKFKMAFLPAEQGEKFKINLYDHGCGVAVADVNGDGNDDLYFCNQLGANALYVGDGAGGFTDVTWMSGDVAIADRISVAATFADVDGDGDPDLYVTTTRGGNAFLRNDQGVFKDVTKEVGLELVAHSESPAFFDADGDGDLDLLVTNTARWTHDEFDTAAKYYPGVGSIFDLVASPRELNRFYRNRGDGTFEDATEASGLAGVGWGGDTAVFDFDEDGDLDVFVANMFGRSLLLENDGHGKFRDVTAQVLGRTSWGTVGARVLDYDGDGRLDLFLVDMHSDMWMDPLEVPTLAESTVKYPTPFGPRYETDPTIQARVKKLIEKVRYDLDETVFGNTLFRNLGHGKFEEVSEKAGVETLWPWGIASGDFDGDGWVDAYLPSGMGFPFIYWRSPLLMNTGRGSFVDRGIDAGLEPPPGGELLKGKLGKRFQARSGRSAATADFDHDGRLDLVVSRFNDTPALYMNRSQPSPWVCVRLQGKGLGRDAIGARVRIEAGGKTLVRMVEAAAGYLAQSSPTLHFGLGGATKIDRCVVTWPGGRTQEVKDLAVGHVSVVVEAP